MTIAALGLLWSQLFGLELTHYLPFFAIGHVVWTWISSHITDACVGFTQFEHIIKQTRLPYPAYLLRLSVRHTLILAHNAVVVAAVFVSCGTELSGHALLVLPGLALVAVICVLLSIPVAICCTRFRDLPPLVGSGLQIAFFSHAHSLAAERLAVCGLGGRAQPAVSLDRDHPPAPAGPAARRAPLSLDGRVHRRPRGARPVAVGTGTRSHCLLDVDGWLSEYLVFYEVPKSVWQQVLLKILSIHKAFAAREEPPVPAERVYDFYWNKTEQRLGERARLTAIEPLLEAETIVINGSPHPGWQAARAVIQARMRALAARCRTTLIHGDLCCSNILYDPRTSLIKFIDPRGEFFEEGCTGDPRYDMAKLLHSFHGGYDFILHEMYQLTAQEGAYAMTLLRSESARDAEAVLFQLLAGTTTYDVAELKLLEALLFLTMLPLHCDDGRRQTALYLRGLMLLKEACGENLS